MSSQTLAEIILGSASLVFPFLWHLAQLLFVKLLDRLPSNQRSAVEEIVSSVVHAIEQTSPGLAGEDKRTQALQIIQQMLDEHKLKASPRDVEVLLEQAVFLMNQNKPSSVVDAQPMGFLPASSAPQEPLGFHK
jgi:hypothetical protein